MIFATLPAEVSLTSIVRVGLTLATLNVAEVQLPLRLLSPSYITTTLWFPAVRLVNVRFAVPFVTGIV